MATTLKVKKQGKQLSISFPADHPKADKIDEQLTRLSPGYVEYLLQFDTDPHCNACRDNVCDNVGMGDDACPAFKFGARW